MSVFVVAEIGINHAGDMPTALRMIDAAKACGADAVKFQSYDVDKLGYEDTALNTLLRQCRLGPLEHVRLKGFAESVGIEFMSTPFDAAWCDFLVETCNVKRLKISSGKVKDLAFVRHVASKGLPVIMSNGMATPDELRLARTELRAVPTLTLLYCVSQYPAPLSSIDFRQMLNLYSMMKGMGGVGYSDHSANPSVGILAAAAGAKVIEAHLTLDRSMPGPDHCASLLPAEFKQMVDGVRHVGA